LINEERCRKLFQYQHVFFKNLISEQISPAEYPKISKHPDKLIHWWQSYPNWRCKKLSKIEASFLFRWHSYSITLLNSLARFLQIGILETVMNFRENDYEGCKGFLPLFLRNTHNMTCCKTYSIVFLSGVLLWMQGCGL
jgi:hypothetical protein